MHKWQTMQISGDTARYEQCLLNLHCLQKPLIAFGGEWVKVGFPRASPYLNVSSNFVYLDQKLCLKEKARCKVCSLQRNVARKKCRCKERHMQRQCIAKKGRRKERLMRLRRKVDSFFHCSELSILKTRLE